MMAKVWSDVVQSKLLLTLAMTCRLLHTAGVPLPATVRVSHPNDPARCQSHLRPVQRWPLAATVQHIPSKTVACHRMTHCQRHGCEQGTIHVRTPGTMCSRRCRRGSCRLIAGIFRACEGFRRGHSCWTVVPRPHKDLSDASRQVNHAQVSRYRVKAQHRTPRTLAVTRHKRPIHTSAPAKPIPTWVAIPNR